MYNKYPYTDFHELNLDWFLEEFAKTNGRVDDIEATVKQFTEFVTSYFDNLDVQKEISAKLDSMVADGSLEGIVSGYLARYTQELADNVESITSGLETDMNSLAQRVAVNERRISAFTNLPEGSTTADAEIIDARIGYDGRVFNSLGDAIRDQIEYISPDLVEITPYSLVEGEYVDRDNGAFVTYANWHRTDYIPVDPTKLLYIRVAGPESDMTESPYCVAYDSNYNFIRQFTITYSTEAVFYPTYNTAYIVLSSRDSVTYSVYNKTLNDHYSDHDDTNIINDTYGILQGAKWYQATTDNGILTSSWYRITSDYLPIDPAKTYDVIFKGNAAYAIYLAEYNINHMFIQYSNNLNDGDTFIPHHNAYYLRAIARDVNDVDFIDVGDAPKLHFAMREHVDADVPVSADAQFIKLRVMSYNIGHFDKGRDTGMEDDLVSTKLPLLKEFFAKYQPDILCLNEFAEYINRSETIVTDDVLFDPIFKYKYQSPDWNAIKSNYQLLNAATGRLTPSSQIDYRSAEIAGPSGSIHIFVVHFHPSDYQIQAAEMNSLMQLTNDLDNVIICGDFNVNVQNYITFYNIAQTAGYTLSNGGYFGWFPTWPYNDPSNWYIDQIMFKGNIKLKNFYVLPVADAADLVSDHLMVYSDLICY